MEAQSVPAHRRGRIYNPLTDRALTPADAAYRRVCARFSTAATAEDEALEKRAGSFAGTDSPAYRLKIVSLETMTACNQKCYFCPVSIAPREDYDMPVELFERIVNQLTAYRDTLEASSCRATTSRRSTAASSISAARSSRPKLPVAVLSNGSGLTPAKVDALIEAGTAALPLHQSLDARPRALHRTTAARITRRSCCAISITCATSRSPSR